MIGTNDQKTGYHSGLEIVLTHGSIDRNVFQPFRMIPVVSCTGQISKIISFN